MITVAYCATSFKESVARAAGVTPMTCPPIHPADDFRRRLERAEFLYLKLHGLKGEPYLYGDNWVTARHTSVLEGLDLSRLVVFSTCCHFFETPWPAAFAAAGCRDIVAGHGLNWASSRTVHGADRLGRLFRIFCSAGIRPDRALSLTKSCLARTRDRATQDALAFHFWGIRELVDQVTNGPKEES